MMTPDLAASSVMLRTIVTDYEWHDLERELPDLADDGPARVGFVGPFNAGKSSLIAALTGDLDIRRDAKPETTLASRYDWGEFVLIDMPGWFSDFVEHDEVADDALRTMVDVVVFTMTVELGDGRLAAAAVRVFVDLGFGERGIIVVNKSNTEDNDAEVIREEAQRRLGAATAVPMLFTDAQDYLDTLSGEFDLDEESLDTLRSGSGIPELSTALTGLGARWRTHGRHLAHVQQLLRVAEECGRRLQPGDDEQDAVAALASLSAAVTGARAQLDNARTARLDGLESAIALIAESELRATMPLTAGELARLWEEATEKPTDQLVDDTDRILNALAEEFGDLAEQVGSFSALVNGPNASLSSKDDGDSLLTRVWRGSGASQRKVSDVLGKEAKRVADSGSDQDSIAYQLARKLQPKKKFRPHERLKDAEKLRKGAGGLAWSAPFISAAAGELWAWRAEHKAVSERRAYEKDVRSHYAKAAAEEGKSIGADHRAFVDDNLSIFERHLITVREPWNAVSADRERLARDVRVAVEELHQMATTPNPDTEHASD